MILSFICYLNPGDSNRNSCLAPSPEACKHVAQSGDALGAIFSQITKKCEILRSENECHQAKGGQLDVINY